MGSPCELLTEATLASDAEELTDLVATEAWRIEDKFSRYLGGNIIAEINSADGRPIKVDEETAQLLNFAETLYQLSDGAFDITSGVLRRAWTFDGGDNIPAADIVAELLYLVGWRRCEWKDSVLQLPQNM
ncbi:MAG: FAD:protein FMN transferase, partial [Woeseiaceae bacterium]|nr:FAD:protein FMN transferase [Woeseiaceae bacterium]